MFILDHCEGECELILLKKKQGLIHLIHFRQLSTGLQNIIAIRNRNKKFGTSETYNMRSNRVFVRECEVTIDGRGFGVVMIPRKLKCVIEMRSVKRKWIA